MRIGPYQFDNPVMLAPMAGVTDRAFRSLCHGLGADLCVSEMVTCEPHLWRSAKTRHRLDHEAEAGIRSVQIAGTDAAKMADAARFNVDNGAEVIDINMGCPAKKVCNVLDGSALMRDEQLVSAILEAVVDAVSVPVSLKIRSGWDHNNRNAVDIARIAESSGIQMLTVHGRTREDRFRGAAEYDTVAEVKQAVSIPVVANGDIDSPQKALRVFQQTAADGIMIGRAAQGNPWIFSEIQHFLAHGEHMAPPSASEIGETLCRHMTALHELYGPQRGLRVARKHIGWYINNLAGAESFRKRINVIEDHEEQLRLVAGFFNLDSYRDAA